MHTVKRAPARDAASSRPGFEARRQAVDAVAEVLRSGASLDDTLARARDVDRDPLTRAIAVTTFRRLGTIGSALHARLTQGMSSDERAFALLATGAAQILFLDVPDHAAVDLAVEVARNDRRLRHLTGLANAVLRRVARERDAILAQAEPPLVDAPPWLAARWSKAYGPEGADAIAGAHRLGAAVDLTAREDATGWAAKLGGVLLPTGSIRLPEGLGIIEAPGFTEGAWWVQDAAAALPVRILAPRAGERILDLCAAPGGKTAQLAVAGAQVTALDRSAQRLRRLRQNMERLHLDPAIVCQDALGYAAEPFDAVLLDAPCTATGTIRRHPDVAWTKKESDLASLVDLQRRLLDHAARLVRPGGRMVYCVCSLEPEEGEAQAVAFLERNLDFRREPVSAAALGLSPGFATEAGELRTRPDGFAGLPGVRPGLDGFFALRVSRNAA